MKLKELKENVVVDIKSRKQCYVLMNLMENAGIFVAGLYRGIIF